jgi:hypothetical protein
MVSEKLKIRINKKKNRTVEVVARLRETVDSCGLRLTVVVATGRNPLMKAEKKLCLFVASLALVLVLLNVAPAVVSVPGVDGSLAASRNASFSLSQISAFPETTIDLAGTPGTSNWYTSDVTVTFLVSGTEPEFTTAYSYDNENWISYDAPFFESREGTTTIYYNSTDSVGNIEDTKSTTIQIDKTAPTLFLETERVPGIGVNVTIVAIEEVSYLVDIGYSLDGGRWLRYPGFILLINEGTQPIHYRAKDAAGNLISKLDYIEVVIEPAITPTEITFAGDTSGVYSDPINLEAMLLDALTGVPIPGKWIVFTVGAQTVSAMTDSEGIAVSSLILDQPAGIYDVTASFEGDDEYLASSVTFEFTIVKEQALTHYSGLTIIEETDSTITLMATVLDEDDGYWGDITNIYVTFTLYLTTDPSVPLYVTGPIIVEPTDTEGIGIATAEIPNLSEGEYLVVVSLSPEHNVHYFSPDSDAVTITVYRPKRGFVMGVGWIRDADGNKGHFVFMVRYSCRGTLSGFAYYKLRVDNMVYVLRTTEITGFSVDGNHAFFEATGTIKQYNLDTKEKVYLDDSFRLRIDVWDYKRRCGSDVFQIPQDEMTWGRIMVKTSRRRRW